MTQLYLATKRVQLRQYRHEDFDLIMDLNSDPDVMRYLTNGIPSTREDVQGGVDRTLLYQEMYDGKLGVYTAELRESGEFMGWFHLRPDKLDLENTKVLEVGYRMKKKFWGNGYATEVSLALVKKSFEELNAESVFAQALLGNLASRRVMEKVGMRFERELIDPSHPNLGPVARYRIVRADYERR